MLFGAGRDARGNEGGFEVLLVLGVGYGAKDCGVGAGGDVIGVSDEGDLVGVFDDAAVIDDRMENGGLDGKVG